MVIRGIFEQARKRPRAIACVSSGARITFGEFGKAIEQIAAFLATQEIEPGKVAVVCINNLLDLWLTLLALRANGAITLAANSAEIADDARIGEIGCIVTSAAEKRPDVEKLAPARGWRHVVIPVDLPEPMPLALGDDFKEGGHLLLTSGTTGKYKLIYRPPESHAARENRDKHGFKLTAKSMQYFAAMGPWTGGGFTRVTSAWARGAACAFEQRPGHAADFLFLPVSHAKLTVAGLAEVLETMPAHAPRRDDMTIQIVGGATPWALVERTRARITRRLYNNLSSTEGSNVASTLLEKPGDQQWYTIYPERTVEVVDENDQPVPQGQLGYLRIKVLEHDRPIYWGDEETTSKFFRDGYFYSGDLAVFGPDGRVSPQGRATDVIAIRGGDKIATGPIEQDLQTKLFVTGVCLFATPNPQRGGDDFHLAIESGAAIPQAHIREVLARVQIPNLNVHVVPKLPRNGMGKIDRIALRAMYGAPVTQQ